MMADGAKRGVRWATRTFSALHRLLPGWYRTSYQRQAVEMFAALAEEALVARGVAGLIAVWLRSSWDLIRHVPLLRSAAYADPALSVSFESHGAGRGLARWSAGLALGLRHTLRGLARRPLYSAAIVVTLALATGATTAIVGVVDAALFRPLPYGAQSTLYRLTSTYSGVRTSSSVSYPDYLDVRDDAGVFESSAMYGRWNATLTGDGPPAVETGLQVTSAFFDVLGIAPSAGRFFVAGEDRVGNDAVVVLGWGLWQRRYGGDPDVLGRTILVDGQPHQVIGIGPANMPDAFPAIGTASILRPFGFEGATEGVPSRGNESYDVLVRLAAGVSPIQADAAVGLVMAEIEQTYPESNAGQSMRIEPFRDNAVTGSRSVMLVFLAAVVVVLLIAVVNVVNLMLARSAERRRELAMRAVLGAGRGRMAGQLIGEALLLAAAGGAGGWWVAVFLTRVLLTAGAQTIPLASTVTMDGRILAFSAMICLAAGIATGLVTGLHATGTDINQVLMGAGSRGSTRGPGAARLRRGLVVGQVAMCVLLVTSAALLLRSLNRIVGVDPGFDTNVVTFRLNPASGVYPEREDLVAYFDAVLEAVTALPGVRQAATVGATPLSGVNVCGTLYAEEDPDRFDGQDMCAEVRPVSADYLDVMGIPLLQGRNFTAADDAESPDVGIVSRTTAELLWPDRDPIGRRFTTGLGGRLHEVVGVVADVKQFALDETTPPQTYLPTGQWPVRGRSVVVSTGIPPESLYPALRDAVWSVDDAVPITRMATLNDDVDRVVQSPKFRALLVGSFAALALVLALIGLYGVIAGSVTARRGEMAIRLSLGARQTTLLGLVISEGGRLVAAGIAIGLLAAMAGTRLLAGMLFGVSASDPIAFIAAPLLVIAVALVANLLPALRAMRVSPVDALRHD